MFLRCFICLHFFSIINYHSNEKLFPRYLKLLLKYAGLACFRTLSECFLNGKFIKTYSWFWRICVFHEKGDQNIEQLHCEALLMFDQHFESLAIEVQIALNTIITISQQNRETGKLKKRRKVTVKMSRIT